MTSKLSAAWAKLPRSEWARRRRLLYAGLAFCAGWISWVLYKGTDSVLFQNALYVLGGGAVALMGQYVFGAAWDDKNYMQSVSSMHHRPHHDDDGDDDSPSTPSTKDDNDRPITGGQ